MIGIYKITNKINGKSYIGQSIDCFKRLEQHFKGSSQFIDEVIQIEGVENFIFEILKQTEEESLSYWEDYYIIKYNTMFPNGYNKRWNCTEYLRKLIENDYKEDKKENKEVKEEIKCSENIIKEKWDSFLKEKIDKIDECVYKICVKVDKVQKQKHQKYFLSVEEINELIKEKSSTDYSQEQIVSSFEKLKKEKLINVEIKENEIFYFKVLNVDLDYDKFIL